MLRIIFVVTIIVVGIIASFYGSFYALLFYIWIAYFRPESWIWSDFLKGQNLSFYIGFFLIISTFITGKKIKITPFFILLCIVLVHSFISTIISNYSSLCFPYWIDFAKIIVISFLILNIVISVNEIKVILIVIVLSLGLEAAKQGWATLILSPGTINTNEIPFLGDNNCVAIGMLMLAPLILSLSQTATNKFVKLGFFILTIGVIYRAISTYSRGGMISLVALLIIWWVRSKHKLRNIIMIAIIAGLILSILPQNFWDRMGTISTDQQEMDESSSSRIYFWEVGFKMALSHPIFGVGHNGYRYTYDEFDSSQGKYGSGRSVHSMWFGILSEWGILGMVFFLSVYIYSLTACVRTRKLCRYVAELKSLNLYAIALETSLITAAVGSTFIPFQYVEMLWHFFALPVAVEQIAKIRILSISPPMEQSVDPIDDYRQFPA